MSDALQGPPTMFLYVRSDLEGKPRASGIDLRSVSRAEWVIDDDSDDDGAQRLEVWTDSDDAPIAFAPENGERFMLAWIQYHEMFVAKVKL